MPDETPAGDPRDYILEISSLTPEPPAARQDYASPPPPQQVPTTGPRGETLQILFRCCNAYAQIRITADGSAYAGHCPKCARPVRVEIDPTSTNTGRFFAVE